MSTRWGQGRALTPLESSCCSVSLCTQRTLHVRNLFVEKKKPYGSNIFKLTCPRFGKILVAPLVGGTSLPEREKIER